MLGVLRLAAPIMAAQVAVALTGVVDTAVMGRFGDQHDLAAVGVASATVSLVYWAFGFLRMATTGLTAQATGAGDEAEARALLQRVLLTGAGLGLVLAVLLPLGAPWLVGLYEAEPAAAALAVDYLQVRAFGAPAALMGFGILGWLLGRGRTTELLWVQIALNTLNATLDVGFVAWLDLGPFGIGLGTAIAEWFALAVGLWCVRDGLAPGRPVTDGLQRLFSANFDVMIRTLFLLAGFAWFVRAGNLHGTAVAAGNEVLLQFITVSAFVLDAFAFVAETEVGEAVGARSRDRLVTAIMQTSLWSLGAAVVFSLGFWWGGGIVIEAMVADAEARRVALAYLPFTAAVPLLGFPAWQLDGVFLGALRGKALRTAAVLATCVYIALDLWLRPWGNTGLWTAFLVFYVVRALFLLPALPGVLRDTAPASEGA